MKDLLITWLNDAYAMEQSQIKLLEQFIKDFSSNDFFFSKLKRHLAETKRQAEDVSRCLESLGADAPPTNSVIGNIMGILSGASMGPYKDQLVKNAIIIHSSEHYEYACYLALATLARDSGEDEVAEICSRIALEEKAVGDWAEGAIVTAVEEVESNKTGRKSKLMPIM